MSNHGNAYPLFNQVIASCFPGVGTGLNFAKANDLAAALHWIRDCQTRLLRILLEVLGETFLSDCLLGELFTLLQEISLGFK